MARIAVETWAPEFGASVDEPALAPTDEVVEVGVEVAPGDWTPRTPPTSAAVCAPDAVSFVDGVRRVDARVWVTDDDGDVRQGICASWAAGVVRCCGSHARVDRTEVRRGLFTPAVGSATRNRPTNPAMLATRHGTWRHVSAPSDDPDQLTLALQASMADLEELVTRPSPASAGELVVLDGPLRQRMHIPGAVGYVKTHRRSYLPEGPGAVIGRLVAGQRTPVFQIGGRWSRWSWYLRLPGRVDHAWAGVVRCEASIDVAVGQVAALADRVAATLPRFASVPQKDPRAPQNLYPIGGLERELRRRLGDQPLLLRALRDAAGHSS